MLARHFFTTISFLVLLPEFKYDAQEKQVKMSTKPKDIKDMYKLAHKLLQVSRLANSTLFFSLFTFHSSVLLTGQFMTYS